MAKKTHEEEEKADLVPVRGFSILHARWGAKSNWNDVTAAARKQVTKNRLTIVPEKAGFPDPIFGTFKSLVVVYSVNGKVSLSIAGWDELTDIPPTIKKR